MVVFLKLGGSLITDKDIAFSARIDTIARLGKEINIALSDDPALKVLIGHGSGSFGHAAAAQFGNRNGIFREKDWSSFQKVWFAAHQLNEIVIKSLSESGLPVISLPASASLVSDNHKVESWVTEPIIVSLKNNLIPVVFGDVIVDRTMGATIFSTEEMFSHLAKIIHPDRILLAGITDGVYEDYPVCDKLIASITKNTYESISAHINGSQSTDVTGGMSSKVKKMLELIESEKDLSIHIFSGKKNGNVKKELAGQSTGTLITNY